MWRIIGWILIASAVFDMLRGKTRIGGSRYGDFGYTDSTPRDDGWVFWLLLLIRFAVGAYLVAR